MAAPRTLANDNAIDLPTLQNLGEHHGRRFLKAMQCLNIAQPLGEGLWEGIPLRDLLNSALSSPSSRCVVTDESGALIGTASDHDVMDAIRRAKEARAAA